MTVDPEPTTDPDQLASSLQSPRSSSGSNGPGRWMTATATWG